MQKIETPNPEKAEIIVPDILPPTDDTVFKALLTHPDANRVLKDVIESVLEMKIENVQVRNNELPITHILEKQERFDVNCLTSNGKQIEIEMQSAKMQGDSLRNEYEIFKNRIVYCLCDLHAKQKGKGLNFDELLKSYQISFCNFVMFDNNDLINKFNMRNQSGLKLSDSVTAVSIEVPKLGDVLAKPITEMSAVEIWTMFFAHADNPQFKAKIGETMRVKEEIAMATEILNTISKDEHAIAKYRARRKWEADLTTNLSVSRRLGKEEGRQEGILIGMERGMERGIQKGRQEGRQEGMEEGIERGIARGLQEGIEKAKRDLEEKLRLSGVSSEEIKKLLD